MCKILLCIKFSKQQESVRKKKKKKTENKMERVKYGLIFRLLWYRVHLSDPMAIKH